MDIVGHDTEVHGLEDEVAELRTTVQQLREAGKAALARHVPQVGGVCKMNFSCGFSALIYKHCGCQIVAELRAQHANDLAARLNEQRAQLKQEFDDMLAATERQLVSVLDACMWLQ